MTAPADATVARFDALPAAEAASVLEPCCGASAWVSGMVGRRPFGTLDRLLGVADDVWWSLAADDWLEAFAHHPRIGEGVSSMPQGEVARNWSAVEQRGASTAGADVRAAIADGNVEYERRFGYIYLVCATGKSAEEMLTILRDRLHNDPATELRVAAGEQAKITRLRLATVFGVHPEPNDQ